MSMDYQGLENQCHKILNSRGKIDAKCMSLYFFLCHCRMVIVYIVHSDVYSNFNSIFSCCLPPKSFNLFVSTDIVKSVKDEAIYNLKNGQYYSFFCILALSTIIGT